VLGDGREGYNSGMWRAAMVVVLLTAHRAEGQPPDPGTHQSEHYLRGEALYRAGEYVAAAASFEEAFARDPDPAILFNIAQAYRLGKRCAKSAESYRKFLAAVGDIPNMDAVRKHIVEQDRCASLADTRTIPDPPPIVTTDRGRTRRRIGIASGVVGLVAAGAGAYFTWRISDLEGQRDRCVPCYLPQLADIDASARRAETLQVVGYAVGGAAIVGGVVLYVLGRSSREATSVAIVPGPGGGFVVGSLGF
jgi:tetratricopeptide (TPR) repeat protein